MKPISSPKILIVDDEPAVASLLATGLQLAGYEVTVAQNAAQALVLLESRTFDAAVVDWMMPGMTGLELIQYLRSKQNLRQLPILMLTAMASENDKITGLDAGADDYLGKPFSPRELIARVKALIRRSQPLLSDANVTFGHLHLNPVQGTAYCSQGADGSTEIRIHLSSTEFKLLHCMMLQNQRLHTREYLMAQIWGDNARIDTRTIDAHIKQLRKALSVAGCPSYIETLRGLGYKLVLPVAA